MSLFCIIKLFFESYIMRGQSMRQICRKLINDGYKLETYEGLDFFGREGDWQTFEYNKYIKSLEIWEIEKKFENKLKANFPNASVKILDSYKNALICNKKFDFIVIDNPQMCFGPDNKYCEHFEALEKIVKLGKKTMTLIFNVNHKPFDFSKNIEWQNRRAMFYSIHDTSNLSKQNFLIPFYRNYFKKFNLETKDCFFENRNNLYLSNFVFILGKLN